jgi:3-isopropylmalate/(R)-2-methylmalate dehydratase large subunit
MVARRLAGQAIARSDASAQRARAANAVREDHRAARRSPPPIRRLHSPSATAVSFAPTFASSTSTTPEWRRICSSARSARLRLLDPQSIITFEDHLSYVHRSPVHVDNGLVPNVRSMSEAHRAFAARHGLIEHGYLESHLAAGDPGNAGSQGISHAVMAEQYALPGQLIAGTDSHTPHSGALGCVAFGVGTTDMANAFVTGAVRMTMPAVLRVDLEGTLPPGISAKDVVLHLLALPSIRAGAGVGKVFEFAGPAIAHLNTDERATLTNMTAELGGFTGIVAPDAETVRFVKERRGIDIAIEPWMKSDAGARYADVIRVDCAHFRRWCAGRETPATACRSPISRTRRRSTSPMVDRARQASARTSTSITRCSRGRRRAVARAGRRDALPAIRHRRRARVLRRTGLSEAFERVGAEVLQPACGACANCGPGVSTESRR